MTSSTPHSGPGSPRTPDRSPFLDNAKFLLIALVALGHSWEQVITPHTPVLRAVHNLVYGFHMPAFILLCGYFSRSFTGRPDQIRRLLTGVLLPYLIFETIYSFVYHWLRGTELAITPTSPTYLCWFLIALFLWRLTTPIWKAVRYPLPLSIVISLAAGTTLISGDLALPRVLMFLPWFVLGLRLRPEHFAKLRTRTARLIAVPVFAGVFALAYWLSPYPSDDWLSSDADNTVLNVSLVQYLLIRLALFAVTALLVASFLALVPGRRTWLTGLGAVTLYPYLLHGILLRVAEYYGAFRVVREAGIPGVLVLSATAVGVVVLLSTPPVRAVMRPLVEPRLPKWLVPRAEAVSAPATVPTAAAEREKTLAG
ncbi:acyltransferase family protein [Streptomyces xanthochromogenes]|uniref:Membrane protein n=1 Tax=Streptomyces xanthochromogenes TaxID=67384 RepID=A0ABQ2ZXS0_9ACTN|nr:MULTISPECIES: acyltransferase family protein [Streptomyces]MYV94304.1 acyltransferase family protein [Streptomyces sp. SID1034]GGY25595.1 membrane protein [Streptomyces xanthochromogenes]